MLVNIAGFATDLVRQVLRHVMELMRGGTSCNDLDVSYRCIDKKGCTLYCWYLTMLVNIAGFATDLVRQVLRHVMELMRGGTSCNDLDVSYRCIDKKVTDRDEMMSTGDRQPMWSSWSSMDGGPKVIDFTLHRDWVKGKCSPQDATDWPCNVCDVNNAPTEHMLFKLPKFHCSCGKEYTGVLDFCIADNMINKKKVIPKPKDQGVNPFCVAHGISHLLEILYMLCCAVNGEDIDPNFIVDPDYLEFWYQQTYPEMMGSRKPYFYPGLHKVVAMLELVRNVGVKIQDKYICKVHQMSCISADDFEKICMELAEGNPLLAIFVPGVSLEYLKFCQVYQPPSFLDVMRAKGSNPSHMVVLLGAFQLADGFRGFYFMNSFGELWCARYAYDFKDTSWSNALTHAKNFRANPYVSGGVGKLSHLFQFNVIKFCRPGEEDGYKKLEDMKEPYDVSNENYRLLMQADYASRGSSTSI